MPWLRAPGTRSHPAQDVQVVIVDLPPPEHPPHDDHRFPDLGVLEEALDAAATAAGAGFVEGNEVGMEGGAGEIWLYGPDARRLLEVIRPVLEQLRWSRECTVTLYFGPPRHGVPKEELVLRLAGH